MGTPILVTEVANTMTAVDFTAVAAMRIAGRSRTKVESRVTATEDMIKVRAATFKIKDTATTAIARVMAAPPGMKVAPRGTATQDTITDAVATVKIDDTATLDVVGTTTAPVRMAAIVITRTQGTVTRGAVRPRGQHNGYDYGGGWGDRREDRGYGGEDRNDRGYGGVQDRSRGGGGGGDRGRDERGYGRQGSHSGADRRGGEDRGYGDSGSRGYDGGNRNRGGHGGRGRSGGRGGGGSQGEEGPGAGFISGTGYEQIGSPISDPRMREEWSGRAGAREVRSDGPDLHKEVQICRRPGAVRSGRTVSVNVNYFKVITVTVERSRDIVADARYGAADAEQKTEDAAINSAPRHEPRPERPLPRSLVGTVINATLHKYREAFEGARVAHDAMASLYSPVKLSWNSKEFADVDPDNTDAARDSRLQVASSQDGNTGARVNKFQTFMVKMKLVEVLSMTTLKNYYSNPIVKFCRCCKRWMS
ncbi:Protein argonaute, N-terminal [Phytophthora cactorum]|nr:Protein argonaute, N-terminal [Phytophthora cactorum]